QAKSRARVARNAYFKRMDSTVRARQARRANEHVPLSLDRYFADREKARAESDSLEALQKQATGLVASPPVSPNPAAPKDSIEQEKVREWKEQLAKDAYIREAVDVLGDWVAAKK